MSQAILRCQALYCGSRGKCLSAVVVVWVGVDVGGWDPTTGDDEQLHHELVDR